nr:DUF488 domain-containing protein [Pedosphaera parvula]
MISPSKEIWTIGHSTRSLAEFTALLKQNQIESLADIRRFPGSRRYPQFGRDQLAMGLQNEGIAYEHFEKLGGRRAPVPDSPNTAWRNTGFRGYADYMVTAAFDEGIRRLIILAAAKRTVIMCAEAVWWQCHRSLIADYLKASGMAVWHIIGASKVELHPYTSPAHLIDGRLSYRKEDFQRELPLL